MAERLSSAARVRSRNLAEVEIMRFADDHARWHKHVHNAELDPVQVLKCIEMDRHPNTIDFSCRRTGKTVVKELYELKHGACLADQELGIVAPREAQSIKNLEYHLDAIRRSEILSAYIDHKSGRRQIADTYYQFANRSRAEAYGIMANVDGGDLTAASLEEVDDMPKDRLYSRFLLMLGSTRRLGASNDSPNKPQIRITGVFKGADTLSGMVDNGEYHVLPTVDVHLGIEMGILNAEFMRQMRAELSPDEYIRQLLCINVSSRNLIWEQWVRQAIQLGLKASIGPVSPLPGEHYKKRGLISIGYDAGGHGEQQHSSKHACVVVEQIGNFVTFPYARIWPAGADDAAVKRDLAALYAYFQPDAAIGDAYGIGMLTDLNDLLFRDGLTTIDRRAVGDGQSTASSWVHWAFVPLRFEGMVKHQMATALRTVFHNGQAVLPYVDDLETSDPEVAAMRLLQQQLPNIAVEQTSKSYASYKMANNKVGDDLFDAAMAAVWGLVNRLIDSEPAAILLGTRTRRQLLGAAHG